jgi:hypothetical protein
LNAKGPRLARAFFLTGAQRDKKMKVLILPHGKQPSTGSASTDGEPRIAEGADHHDVLARFPRPKQIPGA